MSLGREEAENTRLSRRRRRRRRRHEGNMPRQAGNKVWKDRDEMTDELEIFLLILRSC